MDPLTPTVEVTEDGIEVRSPEPQSDLSAVELLPLQGFLNVDDPGARQRTQMKAIWEYFSKDAQGVGDALYRVKQTEMKMMAPKLGESRLSKLYNYVKLQTQSQDLQTQLENL